jgi:hypothetical protein
MHPERVVVCRVSGLWSQLEGYRKVVAYSKVQNHPSGQCQCVRVYRKIRRKTAVNVEGGEEL